MHKTLVALALLVSISSAALTDTTLTAPIASNTVGWTSTGAGTGASADHVGRYIVDLGGDFNGDGFKDYVVAGDSQNIYVVLGSASPGRTAALDLSGTPSLTTFIKITLASGSPKALAAGDINDDGVPDLAIAFPDATNPRVFVVYGKAPTGTANGGWTVSTMAATIQATDANLVNDKGFSVKVTGATTLSLAIGDFFADTKNDLIIGMPEYSSSGTANEGMVCVVYGKTAETTASTASVLAKRGNTQVDCTDVALLNAIPGGTPVPIRDGRLYKGASGDKIGIAVAAGASINGDSYKDLFVASQASTTNYLIYGAAPDATLADAPAAIAIDGLADNTKGFKITQTSGAVTAAAYIGNWNGDANSRPELALGAPGEASNKGKVYILFGQGSSIAAANLPLVLNDLKTFGISYTGKTDEAFGYSLDNAGDVDGSGTPDLIVGAPLTGTDTARQAAGAKGKAYIIFGSAQNTANVDLTTTALTSSTGAAITGIEKTGFGLAVSGAGGDLNGDTYADFLVGAPFTTKSGATDLVGAVYEFRGQAQPTTPGSPASGFRLHASLLVLASFFVALMF